MAGRSNRCEATGRKEGARLRAAYVNELCRTFISGSRKGMLAELVAGHVIDMYILKECLCVDTRVRI